MLSVKALPHRMTRAISWRQHLLQCVVADCLSLPDVNNRTLSPSCENFCGSFRWFFVSWGENTVRFVLMRALGVPGAICSQGQQYSRVTSGWRSSFVCPLVLRTEDKPVGSS